MNTSIVLATVLCLLCMILTEWVHGNLAKQTFILPFTNEGKVVASRCPLTLGVSDTLSTAQVQVQKPREAVPFWWQKIGHPAVTSIAVKLVWDFSLRLLQMCTAVPLTKKQWCAIYQPQTMTEKSSCQCLSCRQPGGQHMFPGNICNSLHFQHKHKELAELVHLKWAHALAYSVSPLGPHVRKMLLSVRTPPLHSHPVQ